MAYELVFFTGEISFRFYLRTRSFPREPYQKIRNLALYACRLVEIFLNPFFSLYYKGFKDPFLSTFVSIQILGVRPFFTFMCVLGFVLLCLFLPQVDSGRDTLTGLGT